MDYEAIIYEVERRRARITLNRPEKLNALSIQLQQELNHALWEADNDDRVHTVILRGAGRAFSAGYDLTPRPLVERDPDDTSREGRSFWGSTFLTWTATIAIAFAAGFVLTYGVDPPSDALSLTIIGVVELVLLMMFFRYWKTAWIAIDLYKRPPTEKDFDESKGFLPSKDTPGVD